MTEPGRERLQRALDRFDQANSDDPRTEMVEGRPLPRELAYARRMSACLEDWAPRCGEALRLAARSQHLCRWRLPRSSFDAGRRGYLRWRRQCAVMHAQLATDILAELDYDEVTIKRVADLLQKKNLDSDPEVQILEDVACLVFLRFYAGDFAERHAPAETSRVLKRTWRKMSDAARRRALELQLSVLEGEPLGVDGEAAPMPAAALDGSGEERAR
jgi:hypothetical protein